LLSEFERKTIREVGLFAKTITIPDEPTKGKRQPNLKSMYKFTKQLKRKAVIRNAIMIDFGFPNLTTNNQKPYFNKHGEKRS
jgi:hypothetical protein